MNKLTKLRLKWVKKSNQRSYHSGYEQGYFDATIEFDLGINKYKVTKEYYICNDCGLERTNKECKWCKYPNVEFTKENNKENNK